MPPYSSLRRGRVSISGQAYLVTTVSAGRHPWFVDLYLGRLAVTSMHSLDAEGLTHTLAFVVMPDHVHWLLTLGGHNSLAAAIRLFKGRVARALSVRLQRRGSIW